MRVSPLTCLLMRETPTSTFVDVVVVTIALYLSGLLMLSQETTLTTKCTACQRSLPASTYVTEITETWKCKYTLHLKVFFLWIVTNNTKNQLWLDNCNATLKQQAARTWGKCITSWVYSVSTSVVIIWHLKSIYVFKVLNVYQIKQLSPNFENIQKPSSQ